MAKEYTIKDARQLINRHKELISNLEHISSISSNINAEIRKNANDLVIRGTIKRLVFDDCAKPMKINAKIQDVEKLIQSLYKYQKASSAIDSAKAFQNSTSAKVKKNIDLLNPGLAGLSWLFGGKRVKEQATRAYHELSALLNESYSQIIPSLMADVDETEYLPTDIAWDAYESNPTSFSEILKKAIPDIFLYDSINNPFQEQLTRLDALRQKETQCEVATDSCEDKIKLAAERMMAQTSLEILKDVPVDEVNRAKAGFRIKTLKDAGFNTMADVYSASIFQLSSLYGISENAATSMKRIAKELLDGARKDVKIKLSADNRNNQATELIKAIYAYKLKKISRDELRKIIDSNKQYIDEAEKKLVSVGSGIPWLFYSLNERNDVKSAYNKIKSVIDGEYSKNINSIANILLNDNVIISDNVAWDDFIKHNIEYISILEEIVPGALGNNDDVYGLPEELAQEIQEEVIFPDGLLCTLRRYQEWGVKYILHQKRVLLGDEMGLGKTVQAIATMVSLRNTGATHFMVVCPASVITNWCREVSKHSKLRVTKIHGLGRMQALRSWVKTGGVAVTTYETTNNISDSELDYIDLVVVDEAHFIKNPEARRSINVKRLCLKAERLLFMTGTALENKVDEMVSLINVLQPEIAESVRNMTFMPNAPQFRNRVAPVYYRRKRQDVLTELPELIESKEWCTLNPGEKEKYESNVLAKNYAASRRLSWDIDDLKKSCKASRLLEIIEEAKNEDRKVLVFSFFLDTISAISNILGTCCYGPINGSIQPQHRQEIIDSFDKAPSGSVLIAQIQSGGTGLNIQSASVVVICEPQLKPSIENQAISRAYRMGQVRNVLVYRLLCANTIDEKITQLLEQKQQIFDAFADKSVAAERNEVRDEELDEKKFGQLIQEEIDRINAEKEKAKNKDT